MSERPGTCVPRAAEPYNNRATSLSLKAAATAAANCSSVMVAMVRISLPRPSPHLPSLHPARHRTY